MLLIGIRRHRGSEWHFWTMVRWMVTWHLGGFSNFPLAEWDISAIACQGTCGVSRVWWRWNIKWGAPARAWKYKSSLPRAPLPQKAMLFCPLPGQVHHLKLWLTKYFADHLNIFYRYAGMGNDERTEMLLKSQDLPNPSVFVTTPKVGGTGLDPTAANHAVITQKFRVLNERRQVFAQVVRLGQNRVPHP